jgi:hypothetical protein
MMERKQFLERVKKINNHAYLWQLG